MPVYITPLGAEADRLMNEAWEAMTHGHRAAPEVIALKGREIVVPSASGQAARFPFADLCEKPLGARDYLAIASRYTTLFVDNVPVLADGRRNEAKRLILLIDTLYDRHVGWSSAPRLRQPSSMPAGAGVEVFEFDRTVSRLVEMQSRDWQQDWAARHQPRSAPVVEIAAVAD